MQVLYVEDLKLVNTNAGGGKVVDWGFLLAAVL